ncbi:rhamnose-binding lectin-like isoform X1 [Daphnia pulicaria]|uniref:rhamnose-binding lectin-like isoform X1 n=1 Tax=Daphnia pulicaria TaxID=35523 RepID=UPI001EEA6D11|nr:rhamnose-binding lectin-like isoform X1 [Daphnia pulicaria]
MKNSVITNLLLVVCAASTQIPAQWTSSNYINKPLILLAVPFPYLAIFAKSSTVSEETTTQTNAKNYAPRSVQTICPKESTENAQRLTEMESQIDVLKKEIEFLKTAYAGLSFAGTEESFTCEGESNVISCSGGKGIVVDFANYGRTSHHICIYNEKIDVINDCYTPSHTEMISGRCNGQASCIVIATNDFFGDTCPNVYKYLQVKYRCV